MSLQNILDGPKPYEGIFDLNLTLNFGKQWPEMRDFAYETREQLFNLLYNVEHLGAMVLGFLFGVLLTTVFFVARGRRRQAGAVAAMLLATSSVFAQSVPRLEPQVDLVTIPYVDRNFGSRIDGAGMCVFNSFRGCLVSQYREDFNDYARWLADNYSGGGYPSRVTEYTRAYCRAKGIEGFDDQYVQIVGEDTLSAIEEALEDGRAVAVTDSGDVSFYGRPVPHMTNIVYLDYQYAGIVDNNRPDRVEWITRSEFIKRHRHFDKGWCIVYLGKPQLSRPVNLPPEVPRPSRRDYGLRLPGLNVELTQCSTCPSPFRLASSGVGGDTRDGWTNQGGGLWYWYRDGARVGEYHESTKTYYTYRSDGAGRSWLNAEKQRPDGVESTGKVTGVLYEGFPELRRGQTLYGYGSLPIADPAAKRLYQDKTKKDRQRPRVVVNGSSDLEKRVRSLLKSLGSDAFVYGREAWEVIKSTRYGEGVTVCQFIKGLCVDMGYFQNEPSEAQLREALIKADPTYKPGGGVSESVDGVVIGLVVALVLLLGYYLHLTRKGDK